jgi:N-acetylglucosamine-6-sulfatase
MSMISLRGEALSLAVFVAGTLAGCASPTAGTAPAPSPTPTPPPPNLVLVVTDDLDILATPELSRLGALLTSQGLTFNRAFVTQPLCAPSRASIFTGRYAHNHGVIDNQAPFGHVAMRRSENATVATWLKGAGYRTSLVGKYINDYPEGAEDNFIPPGWDDWFGHLSAFEDGRYYNYWVNDNGTVMRYGDAPEDYSADVESRHAVEFIREAAGRPEPLFLYLGPEAPHVPATYTSRHGAEFRDAQAPRVPSFNEADTSDKPFEVRVVKPLSAAEIDDLDKFQQWRLRSMAAVEDMLDAVLAALAETGRLERTYVFFTSDNGLLMGQHRLGNRKRNLYEESIRVPLVVRGPGVAVGSLDALVLNIDLCPTLLDLAGVAIPDSVDGRSFAPFLRGAPPPSWRTDVLIENYGAGFAYALRTADWMYAELASGNFELYDMRNDPWQLENVYDDADPSFYAPFSQRIQALVACQGAACRE